MGLRGNLSTIKGVKAALRALPKSMAHNVAQKGAPALTTLTRAAFYGNRNVYGDRRPLGVDGHPLSLVQSGRTSRTLEYKASGTVIRVVLGTDYARYLIGKYGILPNGAMPSSYEQALGEILSKESVDL
jgi:hypothetical protein